MYAETQDEVLNEMRERRKKTKEAEDRGERIEYEAQLTEHRQRFSRMNQ